LDFNIFNIMLGFIMVYKMKAIKALKEEKCLLERKPKRFKWLHIGKHLLKKGGGRQ